MATRKTKRYDEGGDVDEMEEANKGENLDTEAGPTEAPVEAPKPKAKAKVVTKEQLAKSGLSLRDYMNKQQGLTRKGSSESTSSGGSGGGRGPSASELDEYAAARKPSASRVGIIAKMREADKGIKGVRDTESTPSAPREAMRIRPEDMKGPFTGMGTKKYAKGGSVSSASSRADGIASKGKTRGRIC